MERGKMSDTPQTPEAVALALLELIATAEKWTAGAGPWKKDGAHILDVFAECLLAAKGSRVLKG
jgi:hypothetical protein